MTLGGLELVETVRRLDLVDEFGLYVTPVVLGRGGRLFETADELTDQELVEKPAVWQRRRPAALRRPTA